MQIPASLPPACYTATSELLFRTKRDTFQTLRCLDIRLRPQHVPSRPHTFATTPSRSRAVGYGVLQEALLRRAAPGPPDQRLLRCVLSLVLEVRRRRLSNLGKVLLRGSICWALGIVRREARAAVYFVELDGRINTPCPISAPRRRRRSSAMRVAACVAAVWPTTGRCRCCLGC